jgi:hypothetical protein
MRRTLRPTADQGDSDGPGSGPVLRRQQVLARWLAGHPGDTFSEGRTRDALEAAAAAHDCAAEAHRTAAAAHRTAADFADELGSPVRATEHRDAAVERDRDASAQAGAAEDAWGAALRLPRATR